MASAAGYVGGHLLYPEMEIGAAYDPAMEAKIFKPLGMTDSTLDYAKGMAGHRPAPHGPAVPGRVQRLTNVVHLPPSSFLPAAPALSPTAPSVRAAHLQSSHD